MHALFQTRPSRPRLNDIKYYCGWRRKGAKIKAILSKLAKSESSPVILKNEILSILSEAVKTEGL